MSTYELQIAINGLLKSDSSRIWPVARSRLRCGARSIPRLMVSERMHANRARRTSGPAHVCLRYAKGPFMFEGAFQSNAPPSVGGALHSAALLSPPNRLRSRDKNREYEKKAESK